MIKKLIKNLSIRSDGCTFYPDSYFGYSWEEDTCIPHDKAYAQQSGKLKADAIMLLSLLRHALQTLCISVFLLVTAMPVYVALSTFGWYWYIKAGRFIDNDGTRKD